MAQKRGIKYFLEHRFQQQMNLLFHQLESKKKKKFKRLGRYCLIIILCTIHHFSLSFFKNFIAYKPANLTFPPFAPIPLNFSSNYPGTYFEMQRRPPGRVHMYIFNKTGPSGAVSSVGVIEDRDQTRIYQLVYIFDCLIDVT